MRRRSLLVAIGAAAGCSRGETDEEPATVTPVDVPEDATPTPPTDELSAANYPGLNQKNRQERFADTLRLEPTNGRSILQTEDRANLLPVGGRGFPNLTPTGIVFEARPDASRLDRAMLEEMTIYGGTAATDYENPRRFVTDTDFDDETLVVLTIGVAGTPARQSVAETARTTAGRLFCAVEILTGTWDDLVVLTTLARVETTGTDGLLVYYRHEPRGDESSTAIYADG